MTPRRQMIIAAVAAVIVTVLFFVFALRPKLAQISETRDEIETAQNLERQLQDQLEQLREAREDRPRTVARLAVANQYVPVEPDLPGFIRTVQSASVAAGIDLLSIAPTNPGELEDATGVQVINVTLNVVGGFRRVEDFLIRLENLERLVEVRSLSISPGSDDLSDQTILNTTMSLQMYVAAPDAGVSTGGTGGSTSTNTSSDGGGGS